VWAADITYVPIGQGFLYLVAIIDWASRAVHPPERKPWCPRPFPVAGKQKSKGAWRSRSGLNL
jgi:hypothetical protein